MEARLIDTTRLVEIRWHGRGGQGAVTSAELLAQAAINEGKNAQAFPLFGMERRGAPVQAFDRIDPNEPVRVRGEVLEPDVVVVLDPTLLNIMNVTAGLKQKGLLILNTSKGIEGFEAEFGTKYQMASVDATRIARELLGVNIVNTTMLGALLKSVAVVDMESLVKPIEKRFERLAERNINAMRRAYEETVVKE
ncbi:MAG: 2-oxoacid:acceptor oxidoreductase family protein [Dehalococcoidales bacterium]|nr:MAG: 2-oxoacid:acceptor oxidoreductase family protein [Dehalococcoidales bacterium]